MNIALLLLAQIITLPTQAAIATKYGIYAVLLVSVAWAIIKVIKGTRAW